MKLFRLGLLALLASLQSPAFAATCAPDESSIRVSLHEHLLWICETGQLKKTYSVSLGIGGFGKRRQGDRKTPVGTYPLGKPRRSEYYNIFIPIGYPTFVQRLLGFTGNAVGVHGPPRLGDSYDSSAVTQDWTDGCVALGTDDAVSEVASWLEKNGPVLIHIVS